MADINNLAYKGVTTTITEAGNYQLVDTNPLFANTSYIIVDMDVIPSGSEINITLPQSTIYTTGFSGVINILCKGGDGRSSLNVQADIRSGDLINGTDRANITTPYGGLKVQLIGNYAYGCDVYASVI